MSDYEVREIEIKTIRSDCTLQGREEINREIVIEYAELIKSGHSFPPVTVFTEDDKSYLLADGFHRRAAYLRAGLTTMDCEVRPGGLRDAVLFACGANSGHGLRRTNADKIRAIMRILNDEEWCLWSDRRIANQCGVSEKNVRNNRHRSIQTGATGTIRKQIRNGKENTVETARIGRSPANTAVATPVASPPTIRTTPNALHVFKGVLRADDVAFTENVKTPVGTAMIVTKDAVYHIASSLNMSSFLSAHSSVQFLRAELGLARAVVVGPISDELAPYIAKSKAFKVEFRPI